MAANGFDTWFKSVDILTSEPHTEDELRTIVWFGRIVWSAAIKSVAAHSTSDNTASTQSTGYECGCECQCPCHSR
jgi:hypothetical protein